MFTDNILVCGGVGEHGDGLYKLDIGSKSVSQITKQPKGTFDISGIPYEVPCSTMLEYFKLSDTWQDLQGLHSDL
jgi:hypothetical protein